MSPLSPLKPQLVVVSSAPPARDLNEDSPALVQAIQGDVLSGALQPGERIRVEELRQRYDAGIGALREALAHLSAIGVVRADPGKGFRIAPASVADLADITELRVEFERKALTESILQGDDQWEANIVAAYHMLSRFQTPGATEGAAAWNEWSARHKRFHDALTAACSSPWLEHFRSVLFDHSQRYRSIYMKHRLETPPRSDEHREMMEAVLARDVTLACDRMEQHIRRTSEFARKALEAAAAQATPSKPRRSADDN